MRKPRISVAGVKAAYAVLDEYEFDGEYYRKSPEERVRFKQGLLRQAFVAAHYADQQEATT